MNEGFVLGPLAPCRAQPTSRHCNDRGKALPRRFQADAGASYDIREVIVAARRVTYDGPSA
jgi:hypothetical protein